MPLRLRVLHVDAEEFGQILERERQVAARPGHEAERKLLAELGKGPVLVEQDEQLDQPRRGVARDQDRVVGLERRRDDVWTWSVRR